MEHRPPRFPRLRHIDRSRGQSGFTLLELVAVIGIIALMSVIVVGGFNGIMRAISDTSGSDAMRRALMLARQQACVDGEDTFVWVTDMDKFAVVRKAGTISSSTSGSRYPSYLQVGDRTKAVTAKWIEDEYADLTSATQSFVIDEDTTADSIDDIVKKYHGIKVFDMKAATMADITVAPWFDGKKDVWVFGITNNASGFAAGSDYGWLIYPEQTLPAGYVFADSYDSSGNFNKSYNKMVHFLADGETEEAVDFPIYEVSAKRTRTVKVDGQGKVTIETTAN